MRFVDDQLCERVYEQLESKAEDRMELSLGGDEPDRVNYRPSCKCERLQNHSDSTYGARS
jgi:hypothetical protein